MKRYIKSSHLDMYGNKVPDQEAVENNFVVNKSYTVYTMEDLDEDFLQYTVGTTLGEYAHAGLYKEGRGVVLPAGTRLQFNKLTNHYAYYWLPDYDYIRIAILSEYWSDFRKHVKLV